MDGFSAALGAVSSYLSDLGASITLPFLIVLFGLILGQKFTPALRAGLLIGVGFIGLNLVMGLMATQVGPAARSPACPSGSPASAAGRSPPWPWRRSTSSTG